LVVVLAAAPEEVEVEEESVEAESVEVAMARVVEALDDEEEVVLVSVAFLVPQFMLFLQARWPSASSGCAAMHWR
jgi:hypothetical protein